MWFDRLTRDAGCAGIVGCCWVPHSTSSGQALRGRRDVVRLGPPKTAGRLTMNGRGYGHVRVGRRGMGAAWHCVPVGRANVFSFWPNVFTSEGRMCSRFRRARVPLTAPFGRLRAGSPGTRLGMTVRRVGRDVFRGGAHPGMCQLCRGQCVQILARMCSTFRAECVQFGGLMCSVFGGAALVGDGARTEGEIPRLRCAELGMTTAAEERALELRAWTGWQVALGLIMALGPG